MGKTFAICVSAAFMVVEQCTAAAVVFGQPLHVPEVGEMGMAIALDGPCLFVGAGQTLYAFDVADPLRPVLRGKLDGFGNLRQMRVRGSFVYVVSRETGMRVVDVSDTATMRIRSRYDSVEFATGIDVAGDVAFLSERIYGVEAVDIRNPDSPVHIAICKTPESQSCRYRYGFLYSGEWGAGLATALDASDMCRFRKVATVPLGGFGDGVELDGRFLYCSTGHDALHRNLAGAAAKGAGRGLDIFDISDPLRPVHVSRIDFPVFKPRNQDFWTPRVAYGWAFCCDSHNGLFAVDVKDPAYPRLADRLCIPQPGKKWPSAAISSLEVGEGCLYITCSPGGLYVVPVAGVRPPPRPVGRVPAGVGHRASYGTDEKDFHVYRPAASGQARSVALRGDVAYVAFGDAGLHVLGLDSEKGFEKLGELPGRHRVTDCCFVRGRLLTAEGLDGFALYELSDVVGFREVARRRGDDAVGRVAFWCWAPDDSHVALCGRDGPYAFFSADGIAAPEPLAILRGLCKWDRYPADSAVAGSYPVLIPYRGVAWMRLQKGKADVRSSPAPERDDSAGGQRNGIARFGDRFLHTVGDGYVLLSPDGSATEWRRLGDGRHVGIPQTDGRYVALTSRSSCKVSVWDFADAANPKLLRDYSISGNPDRAALWRGRALVPAGHQGVLLERRRPNSGL